jgi:hypothetical protein
MFEVKGDRGRAQVAACEIALVKNSWSYQHEILRIVVER